MKTVVVAGAVGVIGRGVLAHYEDKQVNLVAVSRRAPDFPSRAKHLPVDLLDRDSCEALLSQVPDATHLVFAAYQEKPTPAELVEVNLLMLKDMVEVMEKHAPNLRHITLMQGGKAYGVHLGAMPLSPAKESDSRHMPPNSIMTKRTFFGSARRGKHGPGPLFAPRELRG
jgi:nucleoside-diphosphate-sugar epimerase